MEKTKYVFVRAGRCCNSIRARTRKRANARGEAAAATTTAAAAAAAAAATAAAAAAGERERNATSIGDQRDGAAKVDKTRRSIDPSRSKATSFPCKRVHVPPRTLCTPPPPGPSLQAVPTCSWCLVRRDRELRRARRSPFFPLKIESTGTAAARSNGIVEKERVENRGLRCQYRRHFDCRRFFFMLLA